MKWGLFGGTFDPIHLGHLRCAQEIIELFDLDRIIFIPAFQQPLKAGKPVTPFLHREKMVQLAIEGNPSFAVSDIENRRGGRSYSIDTVRYFLNNAPETTDVYFIMGQDAFEDITRWKAWREFLSLCNFIVMTRPGWEMKTLSEIIPGDVASQFHYDSAHDGYQGSKGNFIYLRKLTFLDISSTDIRNKVKEGKAVTYLVPERVARYIGKHSLYINT